MFSHCSRSLLLYDDFSSERAYVATHANSPGGGGRTAGTQCGNSVTPAAVQYSHVASEYVKQVNWVGGLFIRANNANTMGNALQSARGGRQLGGLKKTHTQKHVHTLFNALSAPHTHTTSPSSSDGLITNIISSTPTHTLLPRSSSTTPRQ